MRIRVRREPLLWGCRLADRILPGRVVGPALGRLLLEARDETCTLHVTGTDVGLRLEMPSQVEESGEALLPVRHALAVVREAGAEELMLESGSGRVRAEGEGSEFLLETPGPDRPAPLEAFPEGGCLLLPPDLLCQAIRRTLFACGTSTPRYSLHAALWEVGPDQVCLVATDNRRLAAAEVPAQAPDEERRTPVADTPGSPTPYLLPSRAGDVLARLVENEEEPVRAVFGARHAFFQVGRAVLGARYVSGAFPDWRRAAAQRPRHLLPLPVGPFLAGVRRAVALRERPAARLLLRFEPGWVQLESRQAGAGRTRVRLPLPLVGGHATIALNPGFLMELLRVFDPADTLLLGLSDADSPALFSDGHAYTHVLLPLRSR